MSYRIEYTSRARKDLKSLPIATAQNIIRSIKELKDDPYSYVKKLKGTERHRLYTHRTGDYRAILTIEDDRLLILVLEAGHRSKIYRKY